MLSAFRKPGPVLLDVADDILGRSVVQPFPAQSRVCQAFGFSLPIKIFLYQVRQDVSQRAVAQRGSLSQPAMHLIRDFDNQLAHLSPVSDCTL